MAVPKNRIKEDKKRMARQGFVVYHGEFDQLASLTDAQFRALFYALRRYSETGECTQLTGAAHMAFGFMTRSLDGDEQRYRARCARSRRANEARWGEKRMDAQGSEPVLTDACDPNTNTNTNPNPNTNTNTNTNPSTNTNPNTNTNPSTNPSTSTDPDTKTSTGVGAGGAPTTRKRTGRFEKPSIEEVKKYCVARKNKIDAVRFWNHYEAIGWVVGKARAPMKDWRAAVATWERNSFGEGREIGVAWRGDAAKEGGRGACAKTEDGIPGEIRI